MQSRLLRLNDDEWRWILKEVFGFCCANVVQKWQKKIATDWYLISCDFKVLPWKDSNPHRRNQNPTCYHYTTRQFFCLSSGFVLSSLARFSFWRCKGRGLFWILQIFRQLFSMFFSFYLIFCEPVVWIGTVVWGCCLIFSWLLLVLAGCHQNAVFWFFCGGLHWDRLRCLWVLAKCVGDDQVSWI